jgi:hypothetical protein
MTLLVATLLTIASLQLAKVQVVDIRDSTKAYLPKGESEQLDVQIVT